MLSFSLLYERHRYQDYEIIDPLTGQELSRPQKNSYDPPIYVSPYSVKGIMRSIGSFIKDPASKSQDKNNKQPDELDKSSYQDTSIDVPHDDMYNSFVS